MTPLGKEMARLPLDPCLARMLIAAANLNCLSEALIVAAMLSAESIFSENRQVISCAAESLSLEVFFNDFHGSECSVLQRRMTSVCFLDSVMVWGAPWTLHSPEQFCQHGCGQCSLQPGAIQKSSPVIHLVPFAF